MKVRCGSRGKGGRLAESSNWERIERYTYFPRTLMFPAAKQQLGKN